MLSVQEVVHTPGNIWAQNDPVNPNLDFQPSGHLAAVTLWMVEQPPAEFTGNIVAAEQLFRERGMEPQID